jgi:hypothetical protein
MEGNEVILKKIPIEILMDTLYDLYDRGVEYIDIMGIPGEEQDTLGISFNNEYMREDVDFEDVEKYLTQTIKLSDEDDLNELA